MAVEAKKEKSLLRRIHRGDASAFAETYDLFAPKIYRHALYRTSSKEVAEDIMSQTFLKGWEFISKNPREVTYLKAFIYRIANNLIIDFYRSKARKPVSLTDEMEQVLPDDIVIEEETDLVLRRDRMHEALCLLKEETRELLIMRFIDELSMDEIAELKGKNKNALYVAIHRAVKELKLICSTGSPSENFAA